MFADKDGKVPWIASWTPGFSIRVREGQLRQRPPLDQIRQAWRPTFSASANILSLI